MFDLSNEKVTIECPACDRKHQVTLKQIANSATIRCSCSTNIKLQDRGGSAKRGISAINGSVKKLETMLNKFGK